MKQEACYYAEFNVCTCTYAKNKNKECIGKAECSCFISEEQYFEKMMNGTLQDAVPKEDIRAQRARIESALRPEKSKKQMKREEKLEKEKNSPGTGFMLGDNPVFQQFLNDNKKK